MVNPLRRRDFRLFYLGRVADSLGDAAAPVALTLAVLRATGSARALAIVLSCALVPRLVLLPLGGALADRLHPRRVALAADLVRGCAQVSLGVHLLSADRPALGVIAGVAAIGGSAAAFASPSVSPLVAGTAGEEPAARQRANALMGTARSVTALIGPALAGALILTVGPGWVFLFDGATFAVGAATLAAIRMGSVTVRRRTLGADLVEGFREVIGRRWYWTSLIAHASWNFAAGAFLVLGPVIAVTRLGGEAVWVAVMQGGAVGVLAGSLLATRLRPRRPLLAANLGLATYAVPLVLLANVAPAPWLIAANTLAFAAVGFLNPLWDTVVQQHVAQHVLARVSAYDWLLSLAAMPVGYALGPALSAVRGPAFPLIVAALLVVVTSAGTAAVADVRRLGREAESPVERTDAAEPAATGP